MMTTHQPILRGTKIVGFLLGVAVFSLSSIAFLSRPSGAEFLSQLTCVIGGIGDEDCDPPTKPVLSSPGAYVQNNQFSFIWQPVTDASDVTYQLCISGLANSCIDDITDTTYDASAIIPNTDGQFQWKVQAKDSNGNTSEWSEAWTTTIDTIDPEVTLTVDPSLVGGDTTTANITATASDANLSSYNLSVIDADGNAAYGMAPSFEASPVTVTKALDVSSPTKLSSGIYKAVFTASDYASRTVVKEFLFEIDNSGPTLVIGGGDTIVKSGSIKPSVTADDPHPDISYQWTADSSNAANIPFDASVKEPEFTPLIEGSYNFNLVAKDRLGNISTGSFRFDYSRDLEPLPLPSETTGGGESKPSGEGPTLPTVVSPSSNPTRDAQNESPAADTSNAQVLGTTSLGAGEPIIATTGAALAPTNAGWRIMGILWYWWLIIIAFVLGVIALIRKFFSPNPSETT